jgi:hypothetical protein
VTNGNRHAVPRQEIGHLPDIAGEQSKSVPGNLVPQSTLKERATTIGPSARNDALPPGDTVYTQVVPGLVRPTDKLPQPWRQGPREDQPPHNLWDLIDRLCTSMDWSGVCQLTVVFLALGVSLTIVLSSLGFLIHIVVGTSAWLPTVLGTAAGSGASGGTYAYVRHHRGKHETQSDHDSDADAAP